MINEALRENGFAIEEIIEPEPTLKGLLAGESKYRDALNRPTLLIIKAKKIS